MINQTFKLLVASAFMFVTSCKQSTSSVTTSDSPKSLALLFGKDLNWKPKYPNAKLFGLGGGVCIAGEADDTDVFTAQMAANIIDYMKQFIDKSKRQLVPQDWNILEIKRRPKWIKNYVEISLWDDNKNPGVARVEECEQQRVLIYLPDWTSSEPGKVTTNPAPTTTDLSGEIKVCVDTRLRDVADIDHTADSNTGIPSKCVFKKDSVLKVSFLTSDQYKKYPLKNRSVPLQVTSCTNCSDDCKASVVRVYASHFKLTQGKLPTDIADSQDKWGICQ